MAPLGSATMPALRPDRRSIRFGDLRIDPFGRTAYVSLLEELVSQGAKHAVAACRTRDVLRARRDEAFKALLLESEAVVGTGAGLATLAMLQGISFSPLAHPADLVRTTLQLARRNGWKVGFLGGVDEEVFAFAHEAVRDYPGLRVVGARHELRAMDDDTAARRLADNLNASGADVVLSAPRQCAGEAFTYRFRHHLDAPLIVSVWGGFRSGLKERLAAPAATVPGFLALALLALKR